MIDRCTTFPEHQPSPWLAASLVTALNLAFIQPAQAQPAAPPVSRAGRTQSLDEIFTTLDTDRDGKISRTEATDPYAQRFSAWDADGDGFAQRKEIHDYRARFGIDDQGQQTVAASQQPNAAQKARKPKGNPAAPRAATISASILKEPAEWRLETFPVPPPFAPEIKLTGSEEARFAPGMYDTNSSDYFTYIMAFTLDGAQQLSPADLKDFLEKYFGGLSVSVGRRKSFQIDPAKMIATIAPSVSSASADRQLDADMIFFDSFTDGRQITLHLEASILSRPDTNKTYLILLVSPSSKESPTWKNLREIGKKTIQNTP